MTDQQRDHLDEAATRADLEAEGRAELDAERYRCRVCGGFDFDSEGNPEVCSGPPREEPDDYAGWSDDELMEFGEVPF